MPRNLFYIIIYKLTKIENHSFVVSYHTDYIFSTDIKWDDEKNACEIIIDDIKKKNRNSVIEVSSFSDPFNNNR